MTLYEFYELLLKKREENKKKINEAKKNLEDLEKKEKDKDFVNSKEYIDQLIELTRVIDSYKKEDNVHLKNVMHFFSELISGLEEKDKVEIDNFINENLKEEDADYLETRVEHLQNTLKKNDDRYKKVNANDIAMKDYLKRLSISSVKGKEKLVFEFLEKYVSVENKNRIMNKYSNPIIDDDLEIRANEALVNNAKEKLNNNNTISIDEKNKIKDLLDEFNRIDVTKNNGSEIQGTENYYDSLCVRKVTGYAKLEIDNLKLNDLLVLEGSDVHYTDKVLNNEENIQRLDSVKFKVSDEAKKKLKDAYIKLESKGFLNKNQAYEEGTKVYGFRKFYDIRNAIIKQIKDENFKDLDKNIATYKQCIVDLKEIYKYIKDTFNPTIYTKPGNMCNFREDYVPKELKTDISLNATFNGLVTTFSIIRDNFIEIDDFLNDPLNATRNICIKAYDKHNVDNLYNNDTYEDKIISLIFYPPSSMVLTSRLIENLYFRDNDLSMVKNSVMFAHNLMSDEAVRNDCRIAFNYLSSNNERDNYKTLLNLLVTKGYNIEFGKLYGGKYRSLDDLREIDSPFNTKQFIKEFNISIDKIYDNAIELIKGALIRNSHKSEELQIANDAHKKIFKLIANSMVELVKLDINISYKDIVKLNKLATNPTEVLKNDISDQSIKDYINDGRLKNDELINTYKTNYLNRINDILTKYNLTNINKEDKLFKNLFEKASDYVYQSTIFPYEKIKKSQVEELFRHLEELNKGIDNYDRISNALSDISLMSSTYFGISNADLAINEHINSLKKDLKLEYSINKSKDNLVKICDKLNLSYDLLDKNILTNYKKLYIKSYNENFHLRDELDNLFDANLNKLLKLKYSYVDQNFKKIYNAYYDINRELMKSLFNIDSKDYQLNNYSKNLEENYLNKFNKNKSIDDIFEEFRNNYNVNVHLESFKDPKLVEGFDFKKFYLDKFKAYFDIARKTSKNGFFANSRIDGVRVRDLSIESIYKFEEDFNELINAVYSHFGVSDPNLGNVFISMSEKERITYFESLYGVSRILEIKDQSNVSFNVMVDSILENGKDIRAQEFNCAKTRINAACSAINGQVLSETSKKVFIASFKNVYKTMYKIHNNNWFFRLLSKSYRDERRDLKEIESNLSNVLGIKKNYLKNILLKSNCEFVGLKDSNTSVVEFKKNPNNKYRIYSQEDVNLITNLITEINDNVKNSKDYKDIDKFDVILRENTNDYVFEGLIERENLDDSKSRISIEDKVKDELDNSFDSNFNDKIIDLDKSADSIKFEEEAEDICTNSKK